MKKLLILSLVLAGLLIPEIRAAVTSEVPVKESIYLLVRADDMGLTHDINLGIIKAYQEGIVTSASIMPTTAYFEEAVRLCKENPGLAAGIHLTVLGTKKRPVLSPEEVPSLVTPQGYFYDDSKKLAKINPDPEEIEKEFRAQIRKVRATGLDFVYLDWHRGVPQVVRDVVLELCQKQKLIYAQGIDGVLSGGYVRIKLQPAGVVTGHELPDGQIVHYSAPPYTEEMKQNLFNLLNKLEPGRWWSGTHPGLHATKGDLTDLLCDPRTLEIINKRNIQLVSYRDLWQEKYGQEAGHSRRLLVRADDMGLSHDINMAIIRAHKEGIVTSASIMPPAAYYEEAVKLCRENPTLAVGLHLTLLGTKQRPVLHPDDIPSIVTPQGYFYENSDQLENANPDPADLEKEIRAQIGKARASGLPFVYLEEHRGCPQLVIDIIRKFCREENLLYGEGTDVYGYSRIKLQPQNVVVPHTLPDGHVVHYAAPRYTSEVRESFFNTLSDLEPGRWWAKSHPGGTGAKSDLTELLCDPRAREIMEKNDIQLVSFKDIWEEKFGLAVK